MRVLWIAPLAILGLAAFVAIGGLIVQALWNWLLPPLFGWPLLGFWQALGLLALCRTGRREDGRGGGPPRPQAIQARRQRSAAPGPRVAEPAAPAKA